MKIVNFPIRVPSDGYCWGAELCEHFNNEGGYGLCELGFFIDNRNDRDEIGIRKPAKCAKLMEV